MELKIKVSLCIFSYTLCHGDIWGESEVEVRSVVHPLDRKLR
jgi:hypothetical protein